MTSLPITRFLERPGNQSDDATQVIAIQGDDVAAVNLPALPLTQKEREAEIRTMLGNSRANSDGGAPPSPEITALSQDLQLTPETDKVWRYLNPNDKAELDLIVATLLGEAPFDKTAVNEIALRSDGTVLAADFDETRSLLYHENGDSQINDAFSGRRSQIAGRSLNLYGTAFAEFPPVMLVHFDYAPYSTIHDGEIFDLVKFGDAHPIIQLVGGRGLVLNCVSDQFDRSGRTTVRNILRPIYSDYTYYRIAVSPQEIADGGVAYDSMYFFVPQDVGSGDTIKINVRFTAGGQDVGTAVKTYTLTDNVLENGARFSVSGQPDLVLNILYLPDHAVYYRGRSVILLQTPAAVQTDVIYDITAEYSREQNYLPDTRNYEQISLFSGVNHMLGGTFDPELARGFQLDTANKVMLEIKQGGTGSMHVRVVVNGVVKNDGVFYDTNRTAENMGIPQLKTNAAGGGIVIGDSGLRISRLYIARAQISLTAAQLLQIQAATDTPGALYYGLRAENPSYKLDAQLQVRDSAGEFFTVGAGGGNPVLDENGKPKNFLTSPIISTSSNGQLNQRTIPEMETAKAIVVVVGEVDTDGNGDTVLVNDSNRTIYDPRPFPQSHLITGRVGRGTEVHYYFSFPQKDTIRLDYCTTGAGNSNGIHQIFLLR